MNVDHGASSISLIDNHIKLINNEGNCGSKVSSVCLPGIAHCCSIQQNLGCLLDYKCHTNRSIGMQLPLYVNIFVNKIRQMTIDYVYNRYHLSSTSDVDLLFKRVGGMQAYLEHAWIVHWRKYRPEYM